MVCYDTSRLNSKGIFLGDKPLLFSVPLLLLDLTVIFFFTNATHCLLKRLGQCRIVSQLLTGILLGPSVMGRNLAFQWTLFPQRGIVVLDIIAGLGLFFFLLNIGVKTDLNLLLKPKKNAVVISIAGFFFPLVLSYGAYMALRPSFPQDLLNDPFILSVITRFSLSGFPVIVDSLDDLQLLNTDLGRIAVSVALLEDIADVILTVVTVVTLMIIGAETARAKVGIVATVIAVPLLVVFVARPIALWAVRRTPAGKKLAEWQFLGLLIMALTLSLITGSIGLNFPLGSIILGLAVPGGMPTGVTLMEKLQPLSSGMLLPVYFLSVGYRIDFAMMDDVREWGMLVILVMTCYLGKLGGVIVASHWLEMPIKDGVSMGLILNLKGIVEILYIVFWFDSEMAGQRHKPTMMLTVLAITAATAPLIKLLYKPTTRYVVVKRRTVEHSRPRSGLRVMGCVHNENHVTPLLHLLEAFHATRDSPISLSLLHLTELVGRTAAVILPYKQGEPHNSASDRIVNVFHHFEQHQPELGSVSLRPFVAIAPYSSMHNDICSVALDHKVCLILLPFHKHFDGTQQITNRAIEAINLNVLNFAPCSVAILIDHGLPARAATCAYTANGILHSVAVYFLGGPDCREALALASRMAHNRSVRLTVVRFLALDIGNATENNEEERKLDDAAMQRFWEQCADNERLVYLEKEVKDGEGTAAVIRGMSEEFDLVMVGRREGMETEVTSGLSEWSERPDLGIIGDMLIEFADEASVLVVQQHQMFEGTARKEENNGGCEPNDTNVRVDNGNVFNER